MLGGFARAKERIPMRAVKCGWQCAAAAFVLGLLMMDSVLH